MFITFLEVVHLIIIMQLFTHLLCIYYMVTKNTKTLVIHKCGKIRITLN